MIPGIVIILLGAVLADSTGRKLWAAIGLLMGFAVFFATGAIPVPL
jgi:hypothetical protein